MNSVVIFLKKMRFALGDPRYSFVRALDRQSLLDQFRGILANSHQYVYLSLTSYAPLLVADNIRDLILDTSYRNLNKLDIRILIRENWSRSLGFYDASLKVIRKSIGNFLVADAGALVILTRSGERFDIRKPYPGENLKEKFLNLYQSARVNGK